MHSFARIILFKGNKNASWHGTSVQIVQPNPALSNQCHPTYLESLPRVVSSLHSGSTDGHSLHSEGTDAHSLQSGGTDAQSLESVKALTDPSTITDSISFALSSSQLPSIELTTSMSSSSDSDVNILNFCTYYHCTCR